MERGQTFLPDWQEPAAYAPLLGVDRAILAWEWLRRDPAFGEAFGKASQRGEDGSAEDWGLHRFEDPARSVPYARPMWSSAAMSPVLTVSARPEIGAAAVDMTSLGDLVTIHRTSGFDRVLLSDGWRLVRLDVEAGTVSEGPVALRFALELPPALAPSLLALRRLDALLRCGHFTKSVCPPQPRAARQVRLLRTADALAAGANQRDIAAVLLKGDVEGPGWREAVPHLRLQAQRLVRDARACLAGGYRALLGRPADHRSLESLRARPARQAEGGIASLPGVMGNGQTAFAIRSKSKGGSQLMDDAVARANRAKKGTPFLSTEQAAFYLGLSPRKLQEMRAVGEGPSFRRHCRYIRYHIDDLDAWSHQSGSARHA